MDDKVSKSNDAPAVRSLKDALLQVKTEQAERNDVVVDMKEAERARLELLADEVRPVFNEVEPDDQRFDLVVTKGERPRLWIDAVSFVAMGHDKRRFRLLKDGRGGRVALAETDDMGVMADHVSRYVAERILERERVLDGDWDDARQAAAGRNPTSVADQRRVGTKKRSPWRSFLWFVSGIITTLIVIAALAIVLVPDAF
ncbi:MAG: hypothetical protein AAGM04_01140 [Pseudomonadota bacterium]